MLKTQFNRKLSHELHTNKNKITTSNIMALIVLIAFVMLIITLTSITDVFTDKTQQVPALLASRTTPINSQDIMKFSATPAASNLLTATNNKSVSGKALTSVAMVDNSQSFYAAGAAAVDVHNGFYDNINTRNQHNEFKSISGETLTSNFTQTQSQSSQSAASSASTVMEAPAYFEGVELHESARLPGYHKQLLPHRNKRYLLFPESSSFQLIFDLIIGIVDYSSFAILGITCAVAWELPSKPPSEVLEDIQQKLKDGTLGISRRNDSTQEQLEYVQTQPAVYGNVHEIHNDNKASMSAAALQPMVTTSYYNNNKKNNNHRQNYDYQQPSSQSSVPYAPTPSTYRKAYQPSKFNYAGDKFGYHHGIGDDDAVGVGAADSGDKSGSKSFRPAYQRHGMDDYATHLNTHSYYSNNNLNGATSTSGYLSSADSSRKKFTDWNRKAAWYENIYKYPQQQQAQANKYATTKYFDKANWWQRHGEEVQSGWQQKQQQWRKYDMAAKQSAMPQPTAPVPNSNATPVPPKSRTSRTRQILQTAPKHRIYPVFGKRRRRRRSAMNPLELTMERVHRRQHLMTRQQLFGKIEKLYKVRGHNGTECVMRALCETAARSQRSAPQSFISELLRSIFTLPQDIHDVGSEEAKEAYKHVAAHYRQAHAAATDVGDVVDCAARYALCEHSLWSDLEFGMKL